MKKGIVLLPVFLALLTSMFVDFQTVKADTSPIGSIEVTYGSYTTYVNQRVELTATISGWGTPPYTYQWYTMLMPQDVLDDGFFLPDWRLVKVAVPGANSPKFNFTEAAPGTYNVNLRIIDSVGNDVQVGSSFILVQASLSPSPTSIPTNSVSPTISSTETPKQELQPSLFNFVLIIFCVLVVTLSVGLLVYFKIHNQKKIDRTGLYFSLSGCVNCFGHVWSLKANLCRKRGSGGPYLRFQHPLLR